MKDHTTPHERKATKAPAIVAFTISAAAFTAVVTLVILHSALVIEAPAVLPAVIAACGTAALIVCVAWAHRNTKEKK